MPRLAPGMAAASSMKSKEKCSSLEPQRVLTRLWKISDRNQPPAEGRHRMLPSRRAEGSRRSSPVRALPALSVAPSSSPSRQNPSKGLLPVRRTIRRDFAGSEASTRLAPLFDFGEQHG